MKARNPIHSPASALSVQRSAFTLFEVLVVIAFLAVIAGIVTINFDRIIPAVQEKPMDRVFVESLQEARLLASTSGNEVYFSFDPEAEAFKLEERARSMPVTEEEEDYDDLDTTVEPSYQSYSFDKADRTEVLFYKRLSRSSGFGASRDEYSAEPIKHLVFHPSGAATPARAVIRQPGLEDIEVELDAFSSGPLVNDER